MDSEPKFYTPTEWRKRAIDKKQGSSSEPIASQGIAHTIKKEAEVACVNAYNKLLRMDVCPEQARMVLPQVTDDKLVLGLVVYTPSQSCM